jgi:5-(carboxyamino)imidazole ribonucleotide synthase
MDKLATSDLKLGIIAGGQLGKMLIQEASKWDIATYVLDGDKHCPAGGIASHYVQGSHLDYQSVYQFGKLVDILTYEIESINIEALKRLKAEGTHVIPDPEVLEMIQDKGLQKEFFTQNDIPTAEYTLYETSDAIRESVEAGNLSFPFVQKLRRGGYDGRGVAVVGDASGLDHLLPGASLVERKVKVVKEVSVIVARNHYGEVKAYPAVEMVFDPTANLVDLLICPSSLTEKQSVQVNSYACKIIDMLKMQGLLAVEFFIDDKGRVLVNEMAPRPHNSGHHTIESMMTSQFEQHLRAILNLSLGSTELLHPSVMINILGAKDHEGPVLYEGLTQIMAIEGVKIHLYGKTHTRPYRKMGHVTVLASTLASAVEKADQVKKILKVKTWKKD